MDNTTKAISFNTEEVRAILDGRKTQTRKVIKPANPFRTHHYRQGEYGLWIEDKYVKDYSVSSCWQIRKNYIKQYAPYKIGDTLYVRERFCLGKISCGEEYDGRDALYVSQCTGKKDFIPYEYCIRNKIGIDDVLWKPSTHMLKKNARIFLKVTDVNIERLQDCGNTQAKDEGYTCCSHFARIWDETILRKNRNVYGWEANPWVWVVTFEKIS